MGVSDGSYKQAESPRMYGLARPLEERKWLKVSTFVHSTNIVRPLQVTDTDTEQEKDMSMTL